MIILLYVIPSWMWPFKPQTTLQGSNDTNIHCKLSFDKLSIGEAHVETSRLYLCRAATWRFLEMLEWQNPLAATLHCTRLNNSIALDYMNDVAKKCKYPLKEALCMTILRCLNFSGWNNRGCCRQPERWSIKLINCEEGDYIFGKTGNAVTAFLSSLSWMVPSLNRSISEIGWLLPDRYLALYR